VPLNPVADDQLALDLTLTDAELRNKVQATLAHVSQLQPLISQLTPVGGLDWLTKHWFGREAFTVKRYNVPQVKSG